VYLVSSEGKARQESFLVLCSMPKKSYKLNLLSFDINITKQHQQLTAAYFEVKDLTAWFVGPSVRHNFEQHGSTPVR
jgi:hypothetical protein